MEAYFKSQGYLVVIENQRKFICPYCTNLAVKMYTSIHHLERHTYSRHTNMDGRHYTKFNDRIFNYSAETKKEVQDFIQLYKNEQP